jgi:hypothetical protein
LAKSSKRSFKILWLAANGRSYGKVCAAFPSAATLFLYSATDGIEVIRVMNGRRDIDADDVTPTT